jgi:hypothetical protein
MRPFIALLLYFVFFVASFIWTEHLLKGRPDIKGRHSSLAAGLWGIALGACHLVFGMPVSITGASPRGEVRTAIALLIMGLLFGAHALYLARTHKQARKE